MYIVLTAMLALNVSSDVLNGFNQVESGLVRTNRNFYERNKAIFGQLEAFMQKNPEKVGVWFDKATELRAITDSLFNDIETIKHDIVAVADGSDADGGLRQVRPAPICVGCAVWPPGRYLRKAVSVTRCIGRHDA